MSDYRSDCVPQIKRQVTYGQWFSMDQGLVMKLTTGSQLKPQPSVVRGRWSSQSVRRLLRSSVQTTMFTEPLREPSFRNDSLRSQHLPGTIVHKSSLYYCESCPIYRLSIPIFALQKRRIPTQRQRMPYQNVKPPRKKSHDASAPVPAICSPTMDPPPLP